MVDVVRGSARAVLAMGLAVAVAATTGGVASAAAAAPMVAAKPAAAAVAKAKPDKGPGPKGPKGAPYAKDEDRLAKADKVKQSGPKAEEEPVEVEAMRTATSRTVEDPVTGLLSTQLASESINYRDGEGAWQPVDNAVKAKYCNRRSFDHAGARWPRAA